MVNLVLEGETHPVMIHEVQRDPLSDAVLSVDFYEVRLDEQVRVFVPIVFTGTSPAVKDLGGFLVKSMHEIELEGFPQHMPHELTVSIEGLGEIGQSLYVKDMRFPEGVKTHTASETVIATVTEKAAEEEVPVEPVSVDSVKVEAEEKKAERDARKEAGGEER
jgi:large subunit ribosomal protein L25